MADSAIAPRFHHYVPRFYLNGWSVSVGALNKRVWIYKKGQKLVHSAIKRTGGRHGMYEVRNVPGVGDSEKIEKDLGRLEGAMGKILPKIIAHQRLSVRDYSLFCYFLNIFFRRSPHILDKFGPEVMEPVLKEHSKVRREQIDQINNPITKDTRRKAIDKVENLISSDFDSFYSMALFLEADEVARFIFGTLTGAFFYTTSGNFITSDNPITFDRRYGTSHPARGYVLFPVSPSTVFLAGRFLPHTLTYTKIQDQLVNYLNGLIISNAYKEVYFNQQSSNLQARVDSNIGSNLIY